MRVESLFFAVDPALRGDAVVVQYDPFSPLNEVQLYTPAGAYLGAAGVTSGKREVIPTIACIVCRPHCAPLSRRPAGRTRRHAGTATQLGHRLPFGTEKERVVPVSAASSPVYWVVRVAYPG